MLRLCRTGICMRDETDFYMNIEAILYKEKIIRIIREYFQKENFLEVSGQILNQAIPNEPNIYPFSTDWKTYHKPQIFFLSTSPESSLKKIIAEKPGNYYSISKAFRNIEEINKYHSPEFTMLEFYRMDADYREMMIEVKELINYIYKPIKSDKKLLELKIWPVFSMTELFDKYAHLNLKKLINDYNMTDAAGILGYQTNNASWEQLFNQIYLNMIEPNLPISPCFIVDYPSRISPLCKPKENMPDFAERFELYINKIEIGNGNTENTDFQNIEKVFESELKNRKNKNYPGSTLDKKFIFSLKKLNGKKFAGMGLGIERMAMILGNISSINDFSVD
jgi:elongation factor P--beta-lysine ligase